MSNEIATAYVQILPSFEGITAKLKAGLGDTDAIGREVGTKIGSQITAGLEASSAKAQASVSKLTAAVTAASDKQAAAAGRVRVAETALAEVRDREGAKASQIVAAEERLAAAQRAQAEAATRTSAVTEQLSAAEEAASRSANLLTEGAEREAAAVDQAALRMRLFGEAGATSGAEARAGMAEAGEGVAGLGEHLGELAKTFAEFFAFEKILEFAKGSVEAGEAVERTSSLIEAQIEATGSAAHVTAEQVQELATQVSDSSGVARAQILLSEQAILRFANVANQPGRGNDIFTRASKDAADLAAVMHTDVPSAAALLGKALNNPTVGLTRLTRAGVSFTAQQTAQIKSLTNSGHLLEAQGIILDHFEGQFAGAAAASATPLDRLKAAVNNLQASVGQALLPVLDAGIEKLADFATKGSDKAQAGLTKLSAAFTALGEHNDVDLGKALGVGPDSGLVKDLDSVRDGISTMVSNIQADLPKALPALKQMGTDLAELSLVADSGFATSLANISDGISKVADASGKLNGSSGGAFFEALAHSIPGGVGQLSEVGTALAHVTDVFSSGNLSASQYTATAQQLGLSMTTVTAAANGNASAQATLRAQLQGYIAQATGATATSGEYGQAVGAAGQKTVTAANAAAKLLGWLNGIPPSAKAAASGAKAVGTEVGKIGSSAAGAAPQVATLTAAQLAAQATQERLTADTNAYRTALSGIDARITAIVNHFQGLQGAEDQLATDTLALGASVKQNGKDFDGNSAKALANRSAIRQVGTDYGAFADQVAKSGKPLKEQQALLNGRRDDLLAYARSLGLSGPQLATFTAELNALDINAQQPAIKHASVVGDKESIAKLQAVQTAAGYIPGLTTTKTTVTGGGAAEAVFHTVQQRALAIPPNVNVAVYAQGTKNAVDGIDGVKAAEDALHDKTVTINYRTLYSSQGKKNQGAPGADAARPSGFQVDAVVPASYFVDVERYVAAFKTLAKDLGPGLAKGLTGSTDAVHSTLSKLASDLKAAYFDSDKEIAKLEGLKKRTAAQEKELTELKGLPSETRLSALLKADTKRLDGLARVRDQIAGKLSTAQSNLKAAIDQKVSDQSNFTSGIISGDNLIGASDLTSAGSVAGVAAEAARQKVVADRAAEAAAVQNVAKAEAALAAVRRQAFPSAKDLTAAEKALAAAQKVSGTLSATSAKDTKTLAAARAAVPGLELAAFVKTDQAQAATAALFRDQLAGLEKRGVDKTLLNELISAGPVASEEQAAYLSKATPAQLKAINVAQASINKSATEASAAAATYLDQAAITRNQQTVDVLTRQEKAAEQRMAEIAEALQKKFAATLTKTAASRIGPPGQIHTAAGVKSKSGSPTTVIHITTPEVRATAAVLTRLNKTHAILGNLRAVRA